ncbi:MAG: hypothetical protein GC154_21390 [bacterium]|nr:hypothetical protein [bacterium]
MKQKMLLAGVMVLMCTAAPMAQQMSGVIAVSQESGAQQFPDVAYNSVDNTFLVVWESVIDDDGGRVEIHGSVHDGETGASIGSPRVLLSDLGDLLAPEVAYNSADNEFILVARYEPEGLAIAQRISAQGQPVDASVDLGKTFGPTFFDPASRARVVSVAYNAQDNRYAVGFSGPPSMQILFPNLDLDIPSPSFGDGTNPAVSWSAKSNVYLLAYEDRAARSTGGENLSAQLVDSSGELIGDIIRLRDQDFAEESPRVAYNPDDDQFLVIWDERIGFAEGHDTLTDTIGQLVAADGSLVGGPIPIEAGTAYTLRQDVDYANGVYLAVWKGDESGDFAFADIQGRFINRDGSLDGDAFLIFDGGDDSTNDGNNEQYYDESKLPVVAANASGAFFVVWEEGGVTRNPADRDIMARMVSRGGSSAADWRWLK